MEDGQHELRRSQKMQDFSGSSTGITRERSFVRTSHHHHHQNNKRRSQIITAPKGKPTLEIYRPPNVRTDVPTSDASVKLNVFAKEFTMQRQNVTDLQTSRSSGNVPREMVPNIQQSQSSGNILRVMSSSNNLNNQLRPVFMPRFQPQLQQRFHRPQQQAQPQQLQRLPHPQPLPQYNRFALNQSMSSGSILHPSPRVRFQFPNTTVNYLRSSLISSPQQRLGNNSGLQRSRSLSAADSLALTSNLIEMSPQSDSLKLGKISESLEVAINMALENPNSLSTQKLMDLAKNILDRVLEQNEYILPGAKICRLIIERESAETFLDSVLNLCKLWYQQRETVLRNVRVGEGNKFILYMRFLTEMSTQLKRLTFPRYDDNHDENPRKILLTLLIKCCQDCLQLPIRTPAEIDCLYFVLSSVGKELEQRFPLLLNELIDAARDDFLARNVDPNSRRLLLQLIELRASQWQLSASSILYYYPNNNE